MERAHTMADLVELRLDGMKDPDLRGLLKEKKGPVLVTNRRADEGGACADTEPRRVLLLKEAISLGADYVDVEASTDHVLVRELLAEIKGHGPRTKMILSWHDFDGTPSERALRRKLQDMMTFGADIIKIVTYARSPEDNLRVLGLIPYARRRNQEIIAFCMGATGRPSRIMSPFLGSYLTYASPERGAESAPGQLTVDEMKKIWEITTS
jgi:3-dehydroquinate dehydratase type I